MSKTLRERIDAHIESFKVDDTVEFSMDSGYEKDPTDIRGTIISIDGRIARVQTKFGVFKTYLSCTNKVEEP